MTIKPSNSGQFFRPLQQTAMFLAREVTEAAANDPALAMRMAASGLVSPILSGVPSDVAAHTDQSLVPVVRLGLLALNSVRAVQSFKDPSVSKAEKGLDMIRVVSDTAGAIGGIAMMFFPQHAALGAKLVGTAYSVDIVSHAFRGLTHAGRRVKVWQAELHNDKPDNKPPDPPAPPPTMTPPPEVPKQLSFWK